MYRTVIQKFVVFLHNQGLHALAVILGALLSEPWEAIKAGVTEPLSWKRHFNFYGMNPLKLTAEQVKMPPLLLIHGNYHNQTAWLPLAKALRGRYPGPLYTVNLLSGVITQRDFQAIQKAITQIQAHYKEHGIETQIHLIGHSRGAYLASRTAWTALDSNGKAYWHVSPTIGKVINLGSVLKQDELDLIEVIDPHFRNRLYEINGTHDILEPAPSLLPHHKSLPLGHLALLSSPQVHTTILQWLFK